ncbi:MAG: ComF family protein, partial [Chloroflexota bacterium]
ARTSSVEERRRNIAKAFVCLDNRIRSKRVLVIDDVSTSGATLDAAAALKSAGASSVWGLTVAREV